MTEWLNCKYICSWVTRKSIITANALKVRKNITFRFWWVLQITADHSFTLVDLC
ncbi:hypothetical protein L873DRAFT_1818389 [Choiromyces venosus 120613-1]|uniref:Uncharacterized protein n=1 Tax=Choiromyces venosus 120613-1 TaxID=1336337 RepID=A0A3N4J0Z3_9PEZI|nr:hypothetical protein L873DRAFT_1818389 [Choiromyces venosus 120613-1]